MQMQAGMQQQYPQQQPYPQPQQPYPQQPPQQMAPGGLDQFDMLRKYLAESVDDEPDDSDDETDSDNDDDEDSGSGDGYWLHIYGISALVMLAIILYYVFKIRKELVGMYEEA